MQNNKSNIKEEILKQNFLESLNDNDWTLYHTYLNIDEVKEILRGQLMCNFEDIGLVSNEIKDKNSNIIPSIYYLSINNKLNIEWKLKVNLENTDGLSDKIVIKNIEVYELNMNKFNEFEKIYSDF